MPDQKPGVFFNGRRPQLLLAGETEDHLSDSWPAWRFVSSDLPDPGFGNVGLASSTGRTDMESTGLLTSAAQLGRHDAASCMTAEHTSLAGSGMENRVPARFYSEFTTDAA